ncbi:MULTISPECIES: tripartite tricarboxylate transporter permease [Nesterenkonia]|uniref:Putative tricarboxylic transport membrane protein n=1 Tax=Nesterenkonia xinjiangensis TaxID=225327 RepID=A0A7Z0GM31_9MICC|nr:MULTISPECIES: tripartite tricarboxylate transporter permease [Nesterenkonia]MDZ5077541.1 tripartite tricarboxylate transporter permease [Nesterenkonia sp. HG001]NYJ78494.1 putative tricarboxylic transport membrane protein [Nesterenkonia xinjiangensis]
MGLTEFDVSVLFDPLNIVAILVGSLAGMFFGAIPGVGAMVVLVLFLPISFLLPPLPAVLLLLAVYQSSEYGGSISSIILGIPGSPSNVATILDGHPMAQSGMPGKALGYSLWASAIGGLVGGLALLFLAVPIAAFAMTLSYPEYFLLGMLGILAVAVISSHDLVRSIISAILGLMVGTVGMDLITGAPRFTGGQMELYSGFTLVAIILGMFAFSEVITMIRDNGSQPAPDTLSVKTKVPFAELRTTAKATTGGSIIGSLIGIFPGTGSGTASWFGYSLAKKLSRNPDRFGKGSPEGIAGAESANNSSVGGSLLPLLTLGVPGSPAIAIVMGAFLMHGIVPGPNIFAEEPTLTYGILFGFLLTSVAMFFSGKLVTPIFSRVLKIPSEMLIPAVLLISIVGVYAANTSSFELWVALTVGVIAYFMRNLGFSLPAFVLAFVLSGIIEENFRRALLVSGGDLTIFVTRPFSLVLVLIIVGLVGLGIWGKVRGTRREKILAEVQGTDEQESKA